VTSASPALRVVVDARILTGLSGGVESTLIGLAEGVSRLDDGPEEYLFLAYDVENEWLRPHLSGNSRVLLVPWLDVSATKTIRRELGARLPGLASAWRTRPDFMRATSGPPASDGTIERAGANVMHFTWQAGFLTGVPSIYHPHDLQHVHLPQFFTSAQLRWRERWYKMLADQASLVAVASTWTKVDVEQHLHLPPEKVAVVPLAPPTAEYEVPSETEAAETALRLKLPDDYILYPAQTWPHKNHIGLLEALADLRYRAGVVVPLVGSGHQNEFFSEIDRRARELGIVDQVTWTGFVTQRDLQVLYRRARAVVIPTRFEAASGPLWEAFQAGVAAACSNVTSLPEQAGNAALIFDPDDRDAMASAILRLWSEPDLRNMLIDRGRERIRPLTWDRTARTFRAYYRRLGRQPLTNEDHELLTSPPYL
jgi:glycosyltransferase involved in cell wall biosynthesis